MAIIKHVGYYMGDTWISGRLYAMQKAMEIDRKSPDCRNYLAALMNLLELVKIHLVLFLNVQFRDFAIVHSTDVIILV